MMQGRVGLVLGSEIPPERIAGMARTAEQQGFAELWLAEDCFFTGGISSATIALAATTAIPVGIGVVSAVTRHPAVLAMELATISRAFPGRLRPAIGLGVPAWLDQMGLRPESPLSAVRDCVTALRTLLDGDRVDRSGGTFVLDAVGLSHPPAERLPLHLGVAGPRMLRLSGDLADGTLLSVLAGADYVSWAREQIAKGAARSGRNPAEHQVTTFALCSVDVDGARAKAAARDAVAFYLAAGGANALTDAYGISAELEKMLAAGGAAAVRQQMPDAWTEDLAVAGDPDECAARIAQLLSAGSDRVALFPTPLERADEIVALLAARVLPHLAGGHVGRGS